MRKIHVLAFLGINEQLHFIEHDDADKPIGRQVWYLCYKSLWSEIILEIPNKRLSKLHRCDTISSYDLIG
jgi:hypothetical protein